MDLSTGELAKMFNLNKQTLFYYDREGRMTLSIDRLGKDF